MAPAIYRGLRKDDDPMYDQVTVVVGGGTKPPAKEPEPETASEAPKDSTEPKPKAPSPRLGSSAATKPPERERLLGGAMRTAIVIAGVLVALSMGCSAQERALNRLQSAQAASVRCDKQEGRDCTAESDELSDAWAAAMKAGCTQKQMQGASMLGYSDAE